ncbi:MAG: restriction endonuclease subunit S [Phycisphaerales bacterium]|jgi:type I restriction enzyme S subunit|nr:restriction endonuclease subunit S [Phycisphaerales bacterium]
MGKVVTGKTPPQDHPEYWGEALPFLTPSDFDGARSVREVGRRLSAAGERAMSKAIVPYGVAVSCIGWQMGQTVLVSERTLTNQQINTVIYDKQTVDGQFLYYSLRTRREELFRLGSGGSRTPILKKSLFEQLEVCLPPLPEQRAIAAVLGALDDKIEANRKTARVLEGIARAIFTSWFVDFDPVRRPDSIKLPAPLAALFPKRLVDSPLGEVPERWRVGTLGDMLTVLETGGRPKGGVKDITHGVPSVGAESITRLGEFDYSKTKYVPHEFFDSMTRGHVQPGDVLLYKDGGRPGEFEPHVTMVGDGFPFPTFCINEHVYRLRVREPMSQAYLYFWLTSEMVMEEMRQRGTGVAIPGLNSTAARAVTLLIPDEPALRAFNTVITPAVNRVFCACNQSRTLAALRDALLPKLVSGELRIADAEKIVGRAV